MNQAFVPIAEFCETGSGSTPPRSVAAYFGGTVPWVKSGELRDGILSETEECVTREGIQAARLKVVPAGSILVAMYGATIGRTTLLGIDATTNQAVCHVRPDPGRADTRYVWFALQAKLPEFLGRRVGGAQPNISQETIRSTTVYLPPLREQRRIADILDKADAIRRKRKEAIALTEALLRSAFLEMFGDPVTNPKGWDVVPLHRLGRVTTGNTPSRAVSEYFGDHIEWIKSDNINTPRHYLTQAAEGLSRRGRDVSRVAPAGSSLVTCIAGSPDCIGNVGLADREVAFNQQINAVMPSPGIDCRFLYALLLVGKRVVQRASTNSMKGMVSKGKLEQVMFPSPPCPLQEEFGKLFDCVIALSDRQEVSVATSNELFDGIVQRAFRGELFNQPGAIMPFEPPAALASVP